MSVVMSVNQSKGEREIRIINNLLLEIFGRGRHASRVRRLIEFEDTKALDAIIIDLVRVSQDLELRRFELEGTQWHGWWRFLVGVSLLQVSREHGLEDVNLAPGLCTRWSRLECIAIPQQLAANFWQVIFLKRKCCRSDHLGSQPRSEKLARTTAATS